MTRSSLPRDDLWRQGATRPIRWRMWLSTRIFRYGRSLSEWLWPD